MRDITAVQILKGRSFLEEGDSVLCVIYMDLSPPQIGKWEAEDAIEAEAVSAKKQKVEKNVSVINTDTVEVEEKDTSFEADTSCPKPEQWIEVEVSGVDGVGHVVSMLEDKSNVLDGDTGASEKKPAVASKEGHIAAASEIDEPNDDAESCLHDETSLDEDIAASIEAPASLIKDPAASPKKKDESSKGSDSSSEDAAVLDEDVAAANSSPPAPSAKKSLVSIQNIDDSRTHEHETNNDDNVDMAEKAPPGPNENGPVVAWEKKDESCSDNERPNKVTAECTSSVSTKKEDETNEELELDDESSSSDDDDDRQTPATPTEQTSGSKTLFVGNLSFSIEQEDVEDFFKGAGEVVNICFAMNSDETFKGYGYVEFNSAEAAKKAVQELNGKELLRRRVRLDFVKERGSFTSYTGRQGTGSFQNGGNAQGQTVFVRGFNKSDCPDEIRRSLEEHFGFCGEISRVSIPKDQDGCARGIAYIVFKERDAFSRALALNGSEFKECILSVKEARPTGDSRGAGSGRGYGRNDGRYNSWEFGGRSGWSDFHGRSGSSDFRGRSGPSDFHGRSSPSDFRGGSGPSDFRGRSGWSEFHGRCGWSEFRGRSGRSDFHRRGDQSDFPRRGGWSDFRGRGGQSDFHGRDGQSDFPRRGGWPDFHGRGGQSDFHRRSGWSNFRARGGQSDFHGRSGWSDFRGRSGSHETGVWRDFDGRSILGKYSESDNVGGTTSVWFEGGGIGSGQGTLIKPSIDAPAAAAGGNNTIFNNEGQSEDEMK